MEVRDPRCAGLDVQAKTVVACVRIAAGATVTYEHRTVSTTTRGLLELADWLAVGAVTPGHFSSQALMQPLTFASNPVASGLPEGPGRDAVSKLCSACQSGKIRFGGTVLALFLASPAGTSGGARLQPGQRGTSPAAGTWTRPGTRRSAESRPGVGRYAQRDCAARFRVARARGDRASWIRVWRVRHVHPHGFQHCLPRSR